MSRALIRLTTLGSLDLRNAAGEEIHSVTAQPKRMALLAYLAAATPRGFHRRDTLLGLFWPESDGDRARGALRTALYKLRQSLGEGVLEGRGDEELGLATGRLWCDAAAFEDAVEQGDLTSALETYRGNFLEGFFLSDAPEFERWLEDARHRLRQKALGAARELARREEEAGNPLAAVRWARRALELEPESEPDLRRLMSLLDRGGDRAGALRVYEDFARRLSAEHETDPAPETRALLQAIRVREELPAADAAPMEPAAPAPSPAHPDPLPVRPAPIAITPPGERRHSRRWTPLAGAALLTLLLATAAVALVRGWERTPALVENRVAVAVFENLTGDPALDPVGRLAADRIVQGLVHTGRVDVVPATLRGTAARADSLARSHRAGTLVSGAFYLQGDSLYFQPQIISVREGRIPATIAAIGGRRDAPVQVVEELRSRVMGAVAAYFDPRLGRLATAASHPPTFEAYRESAEGMENFIRYDWAEAIRHFHLARERDSTYAPAYVFAAISHVNLGQWATADSLARALDRSRGRLAPFDRHVLDWLFAYVHGEHGKALQAVREATAIRPQSEWVFVVGLSGVHDNRPRLAIEALSGLDPESGFTKGWTSYWSVLTAAHHMLGDRPGELTAARRARKQYPKDLNVLETEVIALAALGDSTEVMRRLDEALLLPAVWGATPARVARRAAQEFRAHGDTRASARAVEHALAWYRARLGGPEASPSLRGGYAAALYESALYPRRPGESRARLLEAERLFRELAAESPEAVEVQGHLGVLAARRGDHAEVERVDRWLAALDRPYLHGAHTSWRARMASARGDRAAAVTLLRRAVSQGLRYGSHLHALPDLQELRGYPPFEEFLRPVE